MDLFLSLILLIFQMSFSRENLLASYRIVEQLSQPIVNDGNETMKTSISFLITDEKKKKSVLKLIDLESLNNLTEFIIVSFSLLKSLKIVKFDSNFRKISFGTNN